MKDLFHAQFFKKPGSMLKISECKWESIRYLIPYIVFLIIFEISRRWVTDIDNSRLFIVASCVILGGAVFGIVNSFMCSEVSEHPTVLRALRLGWIRLLAAALVLLCCWYGVKAYGAVIAQVPYNSINADMLANISIGLHRFAAGEPVYRDPVLVPWAGLVGYYPGLILSYFPALYFNVDLRYMACLWYSCLFLGCYCLITHRGLARRGVIAVLLMSCFFAFGDSVRWLFFIIHTPFFWCLVFLFGYSVWQKNFLWSSLLMLAMLFTRETAIVILPFYLVFLWVQRGLPKAMLHALLLLCALIALWMPFFDLTWWQGMVRTKSVIPYYIWNGGIRNWILNTFGFSNLAFMLGVPGIMRFAAVAGLAVLVVVWVWLRKKATVSSFFMVSATAMLWFYYWCGWPVQYAFFPVVILWMFGVIGPCTERVVQGVSVDLQPSFLSRNARLIGVCGWATILLLGMVAPQAGALPVHNQFALHRDRLFGPLHQNEMLPSGERFIWAGEGEVLALVPLHNFVLAPGLNLPVELRLRSYDCKGSRSQRVKIRINNKPVGEFPVPREWTTLMFDVPGEVLREGWNVFSLEASFAVSPKECGESEDTRKLSIALMRWAIHPTRATDEHRRQLGEFLRTYGK
jgi:hypothetical protein